MKITFKRAVKIITLNIFLFCLLFVFAEIIARNIYFDKSEKWKNTYELKIYDNYLSFDNSFFVEKGQEKFNFRNPSIKKSYGTDSIILAGCSFTYGYGIEHENTFGAMLSDYTNKNIYNMGVNGGSPRDFLYILRNKDILNKHLRFDNKKEDKIDTIIYTYIEDQRQRLFVDVYRRSPGFRINAKKELKYYKESNFLINSVLYQLITKYIAYNFIPKKVQYSLLNLYMDTIYQEIKKQFGDDTKFVLLVYYADDNDWSFLEKQGAKVIFLSDLTGKDLSKPEYLIYDKAHPNKKAWDLIIPLLVSKLDS